MAHLPDANIVVDIHTWFRCEEWHTRARRMGASSRTGKTNEQAASRF
jgi:hypothetical protein